MFVFGRDVNGARLDLCVGPVCGQPSELLKVILVVFFAGYLADNRALLAGASTRVGPFRLPPLPYLVPMALMLGIALGDRRRSSATSVRRCCSTWSSCSLLYIATGAR